jgi:hypothetical protein
MPGMPLSSPILQRDKGRKSQTGQSRIPRFDLNTS